MKNISKGKTTRQYQFAPSVAMVTLKGNFDKPHKHQPTIFIGGAWFAIDRKNGSRILKSNRKKP